MPADSARPKKTPAKTPARKSPAKRTAAKPAWAPSASARKQLMENEVLEHATRLFAERGFAGTSLQDVATSMGLKRPALYYYFKSKEELLDRLIIAAVADPASRLREISAQSELDIAERLHAMARYIVTWTLSHTDRFLLLVKSESEMSPETRRKFDDNRREATDVVADLIRDGVEAGVFRAVDPRIAAFSVYGIANWAAWWYNPDGHDSIDSVADQLADIALAGVQRHDGRRTRKALTTRAAIALLRDDLDRLEQSLDPKKA